MDIVSELEKAFYDAKKISPVIEVHLSRDFWEQLRASPDFEKISMRFDGTPRVFGYIPIVHLESEYRYRFVLSLDF